MKRAKKRKRDLYKRTLKNSFWRQHPVSILVSLLRRKIDFSTEAIRQLRAVCDAPVLAVGDRVTRDGTDIHVVDYVTSDAAFGDFRCVKAPTTGWCQAGDIEHNLCRRYTKIDGQSI